MPGGGEYEPQDSRKVTGTAGDKDKSWREQEDARAGRGEYEPRDVRNVTGQPASETDRWRKDEAEPPKAGGEPAEGSREAVERAAKSGPEAAQGSTDARPSVD
ncbi:hypothetical protein QUC32_03065 [Novosphingobium resinovorum]|uniref:hypothetical protein n=1 Tax=Novosphingobium TaxID=165696 RepID=UPI001B3C7A2C|nr:MULTISPECIES: hypothetical protein [Novosphingobium]MBF7013811.1 hypothetical protein [Novosphingobium sp. HR1a]WJM25956.1 hypothetical protein QUC32_03065 [Novosphingobium resinovorum]